jgi:hypothetical protein
MKRFLSIATVLLLAAPLLAQQTNSEQLLLPVFTPPVHGAHGAEFHTELRMANTGEDPILLLGIQGQCHFICPPLPVYILEAGAEAGPGDFGFNGSPGRFLFVPQDQISSLAMSLRVRDVTRQAENFGTEIPIPRERDFVDGPIHFVGVPTDPRFRNALRIYASSPMDVLVTVGNRPPVRIALTGPSITFPPTGIPDFSKPAYGFFADFPTDGAPVRVTVEPEPGLIITSQLLPFETPIWAFITVTNNETQAIATITPQP